MKVAETAFVTAQYRASNEVLSKDNYAKLWSSHGDIKWLQEAIDEVSPYEPTVHCLRNRYYLDSIAAFFGNGSGTVINFGAGFSMYPYALPAHIQHIEVDKPSTIAYKQQYIDKWQSDSTLPKRTVAYVAADFMELSSHEIAATIKPYLVDGQKTFIILEGVLYYLSMATTNKLMKVFGLLQNEGDQSAIVCFEPWVSETTPYKKLGIYFDSCNTNNDHFIAQHHDKNYFAQQAQYRLIGHDDYISLWPKYILDQPCPSTDIMLNESVFLLEHNGLKESKIQYGTAHTEDELAQILSLQQQNLVGNISKEDALEQGFVTVQHEPQALHDMCGTYGHTVARYKGEVVGYALVMLPTFGNEVPELVAMFDLFNQLTYQGKPLNDWKYFVMGQVCVGHTVRGMGVFDGLYTAQAKQMRNDYDLIVTEVATRNARSLRAHHRVGFETIKVYTEEGTGEEWQIVALRIGED